MRSRIQRLPDKEFHAFSKQKGLSTAEAESFFFRCLRCRLWVAYENLAPKLAPDTKNFCSLCVDDSRYK